LYRAHRENRTRRVAEIRAIANEGRPRRTTEPLGYPSVTGFTRRDDAAWRASPHPGLCSQDARAREQKRPATFLAVSETSAETK
jgi:hypothetical protein